MAAKTVSDLLTHINSNVILSPFDSAIVCATDTTYPGKFYLCVTVAFPFLCYLISEIIINRVDFMFHFCLQIRHIWRLQMEIIVLYCVQMTAKAVYLSLKFYFN